MKRSLLCGAVCCCCLLAAISTVAQQSADVSKGLTGKLLEEMASRPKGHPPERGTQPVDAFKATPLTLHPKPFNRYLSLLVTDIDTVSKIRFSEVMGQLAKQAGHGMTKEALFRQWWDTANQAPGLHLGPHCDDKPPTDALGHFPYRCPRSQEGAQATTDPPTVFSSEPDGPTAYSAIAISNRFDLLSDPLQAEGGQVVYPDCGEYRIIFALNAGRSTPSGPFDGNNKFHRDLIAFEARVPNPDLSPQTPGRVPDGCKLILEFFHSLSDPNMSGTERGTRLHDFFMKGKMTGIGGSLPEPVVSITNYNFDGGQIRTNQFMNNVVVKPGVPPTYNSPGKPPETTVTPNDWTLREFRAKVLDGRLRIVPDTTKSTPGSFLFKFSAQEIHADPRLPSLLNAIRDQTAALLGGKSIGGHFDQISNINSITFFSLAEGPNAFESDESNQDQGDIVYAYANNNPFLTTKIKDDLAAAHAPVGLTASNIVDRIRTQTCAGCHQFSDTARTVGSDTFGFDSPTGLGGKAQWPTKACGDFPTCALDANTFILDSPTKHPPMQFTQVSEVILTTSAADAGKRWRYSISSTVECMLDFREKFMKTALGLSPTTDNHCPSG